MEDVRCFHRAFYASKDKLLQDAFLLKHCTASPIKRRRPKNESHTPKVLNVKCFVRIKCGTLLPVCQTSFLNILGITKHRVHYVMKSYAETGESPKEKRGGDHKSHKYERKKTSIINFIKTLHCVESHYCRSQTAVRMYLPSELSINKLFRMYNAQASADLKVKAHFFRHVFNRSFNLGFGSPRTDVCSICLELSEKLKNATDNEIKNRLMAAKRVHKLRANAFYDLLRVSKDDLVTFSFDCQKNQVLPKVPDQSAYFSRQLYMYNFTIVQGTSKSKLTTDNVFTYCWTEDTFPKASNEIASAVFDRLSKTDLTNIKTVRLVADGCGGQNKNSTMIGMCARWLVDAPSCVKRVQLIFPIVGHSFIPPDRVFGKIEKELKKIEAIIRPEEYITGVFSHHATVYRLGVDCEVADWKAAVQDVLKPPSKWHFQFSQCKRYILRKTRSGNVLIQGEAHYRTDLGSLQGVCKIGKTVDMINPDVISPNTCKINPLKLRDVDKLLKKHFGNEWRELEKLHYYRELILEHVAEETQNDVDAHEEAICTHNDENTDLIV